MAKYSFHSLRMPPVLLGAISGYILSAVIDPGSINFAPVTSAPWFVPPHFTFPTFIGALVGTAIFSNATMAIATVPESTAHLYQISRYVDCLAEVLLGFIGKLAGLIQTIPLAVSGGLIHGFVHSHLCHH